MVKSYKKENKNKNKEQKPILTRELITHLGQKLYTCRDINGIIIQAEFKDEEN
jgi:hypothetical protein